jgi:transcriptional regulator with XRE-family HTH domain
MQALAVRPRPLSALRLDSGLTQEELAYRSGVRLSTVWRIERARVAPWPKTRAKIAAALGVDIAAVEWPSREG